MSAVASSLQAIADPPRSTTRPRSTNSLHAIPPVESAAESAISDRRGGGRGGPNGGRRSGRTDGPRAAGLDGMELEETRQAKPQSGRRGKPSTGRPRANGSTARVDDGEPALSWSIEASVPSSTHHTESSLSSLSTPHQSQSPATSATDVSAPKAPRKRKPQKKRVFDGKQENGKESSAVDIKELDPTAKSFTPTLPHAGPSRSSSSGDLRDMKGREIPSTKNGSRPNGVLSRRAAFEKGSKLTSSGETGEVKVARTEKKEEKLADDLNSRLSRGLSRKPFLECPICFNAITPSQPTWSCLPPHGPPPTPAPTLDDPNPAPNPNHYTSCYTPFHLSCIRDWANRSLAEEAEKARNAGREGEELEWRCPGCQKRRSGGIGGYRCFCGRLNQPPTNTLAPHSCADSCIRKRVCGHDCVLALRSCGRHECGRLVNDGTQRVGSGEDWTETLKAFAKDNHAFVKTVEATFRDFFMSTRQTMILPHMPASKRTFVISLADVYRLGRELIDQEPNRSVQIRRRIDTRIPNPLLSDVAGPAPPKPSLGGLTNLRSIPPKAWGAGASATTGASVANGTGGGSGSLAKMIAAGSRESSRPATPIAPVLAHSAPIASLPAPPASLPTASRARQVKRVPNTGQVDGENVDDWDQSGDEA
ncbi:hypothetical protein P7C73_g5958, partial [Tremellales sp. Uapishka_1]